MGFFRLEEIVVKFRSDVYPFFVILLFSVVCMAIIKLGSKGIVLIVTALAPQGIFYAMAGIVLFRYMLEYPMVRWDAGRSIRLGLFLMLGIITECYVNPVLTGLFLKTL